MSQKVKLKKLIKEPLQIQMKMSEKAHIKFVEAPIMRVILKQKV